MNIPLWQQPCTCSEATREENEGPCDFDVEVYPDNMTLCSCCPSCRARCERNI